MTSLSIHGLPHEQRRPHTYQEVALRRTQLRVSESSGQCFYGSRCRGQNGACGTRGFVGTLHLHTGLGVYTGFHTEGGHPGIPPQTQFPPPRISGLYYDISMQVCDSRTELVADLLLIFHGKYSYINVNSVNMNLYTWHRRKCYAIPIRR